MAEDKKEFTTALSQWNTSITNLVSGDFGAVGVPFDDYSKTCAMNAVTALYGLAQRTDGVVLNKMDMSNLREIVGQAASLKLNANAVPAECFFQIRKKKINGTYVDAFEMVIGSRGYESLLRNFGVNVKTVYPCWVVKEGDEFVYPKHRGVRMEPPEWEEKGQSNKAVRVVYPLMLNDGTEQYLIAEREDVRVNLFAHIRQNMMNETFGICDNAYKAKPEQKQAIKEKKEEIFSQLRECKTVDEMLAVEAARPYLSPVWQDMPEQMIVTKMCLNATKRYAKDMNALAKKSLLDTDETYKVHREEEEEEANSEEFIIDAEEVTSEESADV